jgi:hypothetical protein
VKKILALCAALLLAGGAVLAYRLARPAHFGGPFKGAEAVAVAELLDRADGRLNADVRVEGRIERQCPASGCWFDLAAPDGRQLHVEMGHLGITLPQNVGRVAVVEGRLNKTEEGVELIGNGVEFHGKSSAGGTGGSR